mmetsp:Transcript_48475/g.103102  ORF Transcript_48475/g.103102 Transcript_48475/m.103102 type:complete len:360 (-) Transcript_48475:534-1613(-)
MANPAFGAPSSSRSFRRRMRHPLAMATAVVRASPVHIRTSIPALWHSAMAPGTDARSGSSMPTTATSVRFDSSPAESPFHPPCGTSSKSRYASARVLRPLSWQAATMSVNASLSLSSSGWVFTTPSAVTSVANDVQAAITCVGAPLLYRRYRPAYGSGEEEEDAGGCSTHLTIHDMRFLSDENGIECTPQSSIDDPSLNGPRRDSASHPSCRVSLINAQSVGLPTYTVVPVPPSIVTADVGDTFSSIDSQSSLALAPFVWKADSIAAPRDPSGPPRPTTCSCLSPAYRAVMTVILFSVSVPVLSLHMVVALPMVSHESMCFTWLASSVMRRIDTARARVTARGRPSGTATTRMVMATMK